MLGRITILYTALGGALVKKVILEMKLDRKCFKRNNKMNQVLKCFILQ